MLNSAGHRVYAVMDRNKWLGGALSGLIITQLIIGIYMIVSAAVLPRNFFGSLFRSQADSGPSIVQQLPDIDLDPFQLCTTTWIKPQELLFVNVGIAFGTSSPHLGNSDDPHIPHSARPGSSQRFLCFRQFLSLPENSNMVDIRASRAS